MSNADSKQHARGMPIYQALAEDFVKEGVDTHFALMGDGNMHWATAMNGMPGMQFYHARHEHCACAMAMGYYGMTGKVGVASVTCGPGFTQTMTALTTAARNRTPLVVFAGEVPIHQRWFGQYVEQPPLAAPTGAFYIQAHSPQRMHDYVQQAFYVARAERRPVVLGVPFDLQLQPLPDIGAYKPSSLLTPDLGRTMPDPAQIEMIVEKLLAAKCAIILGGRGALYSGADRLAEQLADKTGAFLATTLPGRGMFDQHPFSLGVSGGFARDIAREIGAQAEFVLAVGASMSYYTFDGGRMYPKAVSAQINTDPVGFHQGRKTADIHVRADAKAAVEAILAKIGSRNSAGTLRTDEMARRIREEPADAATFTIEPGLVDPRDAIDELDAHLPKDFVTLSGSGHQSYFLSVMRGRRPQDFIAFREFGVIGNSISFTIGAAAVRKDGGVALIEGDGSLLMHIQELETIKRHKMKLLICVMNDGTYGSELHKLREDGLDVSGVMFGRPEFESIAKGFGLRGATITDRSQFAKVIQDYLDGDTAMVMDIHISEDVPSPRMRSGLKQGHGKM